MLIGDMVYLWQGVGKLKPPMSGIFARGRIIKCPHDCQDYELSASYWVDQVNALKSMPRVLVAIDSCRPFPLISRTDFAADPVLVHCSILKMGQGSNFSLTTEQSSRIHTFYI